MTTPVDVPPEEENLGAWLESVDGPEPHAFWGTDPSGCCGCSDCLADDPNGDSDLDQLAYERWRERDLS